MYPRYIRCPRPSCRHPRAEPAYDQTTMTLVGVYCPNPHCPGTVACPHCTRMIGVERHRIDCPVGRVVDGILRAGIPR